MKKLFTFLLTLFIVSSVVAQEEADFTEGGISYVIISKSPNQVSVTMNKAGYSGNIVIPEQVTSDATTYTVVQIGYQAFQSQTGLTGITIPNTVQSIGNSAFFWTNIESVVIPNSVKMIESSAFSYSSKLETVDIGDSLTIISNNAFTNCYILVSFSVSAQNPNFSSYANALYNKDQTILHFYPASLTTLNIANTTETIGEWAFHRSNLTSVVLPEPVASIGNQSFYQSKLTSLDLPKTILSIGSTPFSSCLAHYEINVHADNPNFSSIDGVLYNKDNSILVRCPQAKVGTVVIPLNTDSLANNSFSLCTQITEIVANPLNPPKLGSQCFTSITKANVDLFIPSQSEELYRSAIEWQDFNIVSSNSLEGTDAVCFNNSAELELIAPTSTIEKWQFSINLGNNWTDIIDTSTDYITSALQSITWFRVILDNGDTSNVKVIYIDTIPAISGSNLICTGGNSGLMSITGHTSGKAEKWQYSINDGSSWTDIVGPQSSYTTYGLTKTTWYRAVLQDALCGNDTTEHVVIEVKENSYITGEKTICTGDNSGVLTLVDFIPPIQKWQQSINGFIWNDIEHTDATYTSDSLTEKTWFRAVSSDSICSENSDHVVITVDHVPTLTGGNNEICAGENTSGLITLTGHSSKEISAWQYSTNDGANWNHIENTQITYTSDTLNETTWIRAVIVSGVCGVDTSNIIAVNVNPSTVAGTLTGNNTICAGSNSGELSLSGNVGDVKKWQFSTNSGTSWTDIVNTNNTYTSGALTQNTMFRVVVQSGDCNIVESNAVTIEVVPASVGGSVASSTTICEGNNSGELTLTGNTGDVQKWQYSTDDGSLWSDIANTLATYTSGNLTETTWYRAVVKNGICNETESNHAIINVSPQTVAGSVTGGSTVYVGDNSGELTLADHTGDVQKWQYSINDGTDWTDITHTNITYTSTALTETTWYRTMVKSGACEALASTHTVVTVEDTTISIAYFENQIFSTYPNPANEVFFISMKDNYTQGLFELFDVQGRKVIEQKINNINTKINIEALNSGVYFYSISTDFGKQRGKLIKK